MPDNDLHAPVLGPAGEPCSACGEPLAADQRYCLSCGERRGAPRLDPLVQARGHTGVAPPVVRRARGRAPSPLPSPRIAGVAVLLVLGFGIAAGAAAGPRAKATLASASAPRRVIVVRPAAAPATAAPAAKPTAAVRARPAAKKKSTPAPAPAASSDSASTTAPDSSSSTPTTTPPQKAKPKKDASKDKGNGASTDTSALPVAKHVWIVALTGHTLDEALADPSPMPYLSGTLRPKGLLLSKYKAVAPGALANLIALISGRKPTADQQAGCATYADVDPAARTGCVFGKDVDTLPAQLTAVGRTWHGYVEDADAAQPPDTCRHPAAGGPLEPVMARDPFLFFHALVDTPDCAANIAGLSRLVPDTADAASAPNVAVVVPNACHDGVDQPCTPGAPVGLAAADAWLKAQLDPVLASQAYKDDGMVVVTFDSGPDPSKPVGALVLSAAVTAGATDDGSYDHTNLLRTLEDLFSLDPLGEAKQAKAIEVTKPSR
jgi:hypothetical protein